MTQLFIGSTTKTFRNQSAPARNQKIEHSNPQRLTAGNFLQSTQSPTRAGKSEIRNPKSEIDDAMGDGIPNS